MKTCKLTLDKIAEFHKTLPTGSLCIMHHGKMVASFGDTSLPIKVSSIRKSLLSLLYGIFEEQGKINLNKTLGALGINATPPLSDNEKKASIKMLLQACSGVYRDYVGGSPWMLKARPKQEQYPVGKHWYYNNWDFNVLSTIFEKCTQQTIGSAFLNYIAAPLDLEDYNDNSFYYYYGEQSQPAIHPAYHFHLSARDLAKIGLMILNKGYWNDKSIIPTRWLKESTTPYFQTDKITEYGYLWWLNGWPGIDEFSFSARGNLGKYLVIFPEKELVIVMMNHQESPDNISMMPDNEYENLPNVTIETMAELLRLVLQIYL